MCSPESWVLSITQRYSYTVARNPEQGDLKQQSVVAVHSSVCHGSQPVRL